MKKYPKIKSIGSSEVSGILNHPVTIVEKMDGANFRFTHSKNVDGVDDDRLVFGSRNVIYKNERDTDKNFEHAIEYVRDHVTPDEFVEKVEYGQPDEESLTIFAEAMHPHTIEYDWENTPNVLVFDAWSETDGWLHWRSIEAVAKRLGLDTVPVLYEDANFARSDALPEPESAYRDGFAEGIVVRGRNSMRAKKRCDEFLERHAGTSTGQDSGYDPDDDTAVLVHNLLNQEPWVDKMIHKYDDRGRDIHMGIMEDLWQEVFDDIVDENYEEIFLGNHTIDTKQFRSMIASHTADQLRAYLERPNNSVLNEA